MGRNSSGIINNNTKNSLTVGKFGLTPKALKSFGGEEAIGGWVDYYNKSLKKYTKDFEAQLKGLTMKSVREKSELNKLFTYLKTNKEYGTESSFVNYVRQNVNRVVSGEYKDTLLKNGGLAKEIVDGYASARAKRLLMPKIIRRLKQL